MFDVMISCIEGIPVIIRFKTTTKLRKNKVF